MESTELKNLELVAKGKVRDIYAVNSDHLLIVTTDRMSAFDVVLPNPIPGKGEVLTEISEFWFEKTRSIVKNHMTDDLELIDLLDSPDQLEYFSKRSMIVKRLNPLPIEAVVRGYLIGSGWKDYQATGSVCGIELEKGLQMAQKLPDPIYTPATKAEVGEHDENISYEQTIDLIGEELASRVRQIAIDIYNFGVNHAKEKGIIIADTKFEFGLDNEGELYLIDEVLTPDSSRFWAIESHALGSSPPSFDKQYLRDYLETLDWDKTAPGPELPKEVIDNTASKYNNAFKQIAG
ncbi:MAG: phosphoribosylaminoimidazolesuccinocarboxamide synthase [Gammaproteobacteria bacterium]|jgi:phosphoribosylaminoimidazole-succinocarboxamide synthase|nr:phosphoribosylaminoimidazolesuccinocarboxamide synthase [Gammaproteobacteria bacterium]MBQ09613.1 phosphoribosylaminoimidazolesuccinocarboxamide synthase [Gammaproteobacteria bacterium]MDP6146959.1 phosphoribosylaminoimidazolesuccinocarboxamide synthase [Gammaproteobacteria bacterium]HJL80381.1 phosphoribosylaminoimidazolesuccinocarboxamide synthase [Gammaproteobacteria bacterium]HJM99935.1 phosphoribosylaminoimidazolesuccinocarboxamide synthase [Gammaproteobacteria bacterium]|tara:strand:- start:32333 stop:33208 length:876 start_codon:yes stop_codon:yes gene_type:complete